MIKITFSKKRSYFVVYDIYVDENFTAVANSFVEMPHKIKTKDDIDTLYDKVYDFARSFGYGKNAKTVVKNFILLR